MIKFTNSNFHCSNTAVVEITLLSTLDFKHDDSDSNDINELMSKLFEDEIQSKKLKRLKENYEFVLDADNVSEESSDSKDKDKWLQNETHDENEENPEKLIIF